MSAPRPTNDPRPQPDYRPANPPHLDTIDDLLTRKQMAEWFGVGQRQILEYVYGTPPLPFFRYNRRYYFSKRQVAWWFQTFQSQPDPMLLDVRRAKREAKRIAGRKKT